MTQGSTVRSISYTADGNTLTDNLGTGAVFTYGYNNDNRMVQASLGGATQASYTLNYLGQRVIKSAVTSGTTHFHYDRAGHLIAESDGSGNVLREYVFLGDTPVAFVTPTGGIDIIHTDHLGTPQKMTDATQAVVWDGGASDPFMMSALPTTPGMGLRLPGQYYDGETGLHYNYFRDYDPSLGRYIESDPIGLRGGINTYAYVGGNPVALNDPSGRNPALLGAIIGGGGDLLYQLYRNGGRMDCVNWGEVGGAALSGAVLGMGGAIIGEVVGELLAAEAVAGAEMAEAAAAEGEGLGLGAADSWGNPSTLSRHFAEHGADFGASSEGDYASQASRFLERSQSEGAPTKIDPNGTIRTYDPNTNTFGSYNADGTTRTFFKPTSPTYFDRQPGVAPTNLGGP